MTAKEGDTGGADEKPTPKSSREQELRLRQADRVREPERLIEVESRARETEARGDFRGAVT